MSDMDRANPEAKAAKMREGSPDNGAPSSSSGRKWTEEQKREASERMKQSHLDGTAPKGGRKPKAAPAKQEPITEEEEKMVGLMIGSLWNIGSPMVKLAKLDKDDEHVVGRAATPVIRKYLPMLGDWSLELTLLFTVAMMVTAKRAQWKKEHPEDETTPDLEFPVPTMVPT